MTTAADIDWRVYVIVDPTAIPAGSSCASVAVEAIEGGAGIIQFRDKQSPTRVAWKRGQRVRTVCEELGVPFVVNDRLDLALALDADGVHLGPDDLPIAEAARIAPDLIIGGSAGTPREAASLVEAGATYLGSGAVFDASGSKPDAMHNRGPQALRDVVDAVDVPVVGIGGITPGNAPLVAATGAHGVAVIRAVCGAPNARAATRALRDAFERGRPT